MNKKDYQKPALRVVALRAAAIVCGSPAGGPKAYNTQGSAAQYSRSTGGWDFDNEEQE